MENNKVVLAYSGGLDTSFCIKYLTIDKGLEVHAVMVDTGGFTEGEVKAAEEKAYTLGASKFTRIDTVKDYYIKCIMAVVEYANEVGAKYVAHGSTGAGNDQVRFDLMIQILGQNLEIITPIRDLQLSRQAEIEYLKKHGIEMDWQKAQYSINKGIWGTSVGGAETLRTRRY